MINFHDLSSTQFEKIIVLISKKIFGISASEFCPGRDGGRDSKFVGVAELYPSEAMPWSGIIIVQAKHTKSSSASCSDNDFFKNDSSVINLEIPKIKNLFDSGELTHYILFTNRRLTAGFESKIIQHISKNTGIACENIGLIGEQDLYNYCRLCRTEIDDYLSNDYHVEMPLVYDPRDIADIIDGINDFFKNETRDTFIPPTKRTSYVDKNKLNSMDDTTADFFMKKYLKYIPKITEFLSDPINEEYIEKYENIVDTLQRKIAVYQKNEADFGKILDKLIDILEVRVNRNKRLGSAIVFYLYWNCDIGRVKDDKTK